jgi:hypothetical protein
VHDPITGVASKAALEVQHLGSPEPRWLEACLLVPRPWLASWAGQKTRAGLGRIIDQELEARASPRALSEGYSVLRLGDPRGVGRGVSSVGNH